MGSIPVGEDERVKRVFEGKMKKKNLLICKVIV